MTRPTAQIEHDIKRILVERARILRACGGQPADDDRAQLRSLDRDSARLHSELRDARNGVTGTVNRATPRPIETDGGALERYRKRAMRVPATRPAPDKRAS